VSITLAMMSRRRTTIRRILYAMSSTPTLRPWSCWSVAAAAIVMFLLACSMTAQARRDARLRAGLDAHRFHQPLSTIWPAALHLLADHGYQLVGRDRLVVGAPPAPRFKRLTAGGFETGHSRTGFVMETMTNASGTRYRVEGQDIDEKSCRITFVAIRRTGGAPSEERSRDLDMELELVRRLEPDAAARIAQAADAAK
jgi:hypothetical protein